MATLNSTAPPSLNIPKPKPSSSCCLANLIPTKRDIKNSTSRSRSRCSEEQRRGDLRCRARGIADFIGGDLVRLDLGQWPSDVEEHKALAIYSPHEGGYEGRYLNQLRYEGYHFLDLSARGVGDPETTPAKIHPVCPVSRELCSGLLKLRSKSELQFLALLPSLRPRVRIIAECGNWRQFVWKPLKEIAGD